LILFLGKATPSQDANCHQDENSPFAKHGVSPLPLFEFVIQTNDCKKHTLFKRSQTPKARQKTTATIHLGDGSTINLIGPGKPAKVTDPRESDLQMH
jgi:hypothetical protein